MDDRHQRAIVLGRLRRLPQQLDRARDRRERVADLVRDAGRELADRREPLGAPRVQLEPAQLGEVLEVDHAADHLIVDVAQRRHRHADRDARRRTPAPEGPRGALALASASSTDSPGITVSIGVTVSPLRDVRDQEIGRVINFQDLTELRRLELQSRRAERLATVGQLAAGVAHEIRNPLASISGSIELLKQSPQASEDDRALMTIVHREIQRLNMLIGDLLDYANPRPSQPVEFDLGVLVEETLQVARADQAFAQIELAADVVQPLRIPADPAKLRQVLWNLVRNAADAALVGGKHVRVAVKATAKAATIAVADDGPGIEQEALGRIFDPFFTTKKRGTGLGLATSHAVVAEHGGRIDVTTEVGKGTTMLVTLPRPVVSVDQEAPVAWVRAVPHLCAGPRRRRARDGVHGVPQVARRRPVGQRDRRVPRAEPGRAARRGDRERRRTARGHERVLVVRQARARRQEAARPRRRRAVRRVRVARVRHPRRRARRDLAVSRPQASDPDLAEAGSRKPEARRRASGSPRRTPLPLARPRTGEVAAPVRLQARRQLARGAHVVEHGDRVVDAADREQRHCARVLQRRDVGPERAGFVDQRERGVGVTARGKRGARAVVEPDRALRGGEPRTISKSTRACASAASSSPAAT